MKYDVEKPRKYWIKGDRIYWSEPANIGKVLTVIDKKAYDALLKEAMRLRESVDDNAICDYLDNGRHSPYCDKCKAIKRFDEFIKGEE